jgi:hypothetical protein
MRNRFVWVVVTGVALVGLAILLSLGGARRTQTRRSDSANRGANGSSGVAGVAADLLGKLKPQESEAERRVRMMSSKTNRSDFRLSEQDVYQYVQGKGSNAVSLVAGFESTRNKDYLKVALEKFPNDPFVQAKALLWLDLSPEERARMLDAFKQSAPTNAFPNLLAAMDAMKRGDTSSALAEIAAAREKRYDEFDRQSVQGLEEAYLASGRSEAEAKTLGMAEITLPQLVQFRGLGKQLIELAEKAAATGDATTQQSMLTMNWEIGQKLRTETGSVPLIGQLVGIAMQNDALSKWPGGVDFDGRSAADLLASNVAARKELQTAGPVFEKWFPTAPDEEIINYMDMTKASGERQAMAWLKEQHPEFAQMAPPNN